MNWKVVDIKSEFATFQCTSGLQICNLDNENIGVNLKNMLSFIVQVVFKSWCEIRHAVIQTQIVLACYHNCTVARAVENHSFSDTILRLFQSLVILCATIAQTRHFLRYCERQKKYFAPTDWATIYFKPPLTFYRVTVVLNIPFCYFRSNLAFVSLIASAWN